ncbi:MAG: RNA-binding S4 domain-containing protein [Lachnospirales bacterium]
MRLDKYLKVSRIIKRRTIATAICNEGRVLVNDKVAKASTTVKISDILTVNMGQSPTKIKITDIKESTKKEDANTMFETIND